MNAELEMLNTMMVGVVIALVPIIGGIIMNKLRCIDKFDKRSFRQSVAILSLARHLDSIKRETHPELNTKLEQEMEKLLRDEKGNL